MDKLDIRLTEGEFKNPLKGPLSRAEDVAAIFDSIKDRASETLLVVYLLDDLTGVYDVHSTGCATMTTLSTQDLFGRAYALRARYLILIHNHPKGDPTPSAEDRRALMAIEAYAAPLETLDVLDFIIVGSKGYWSAFDEAGGGDYAAGAVGDLAFATR